ncbi:hypothetical protein CNMCM7691_007616 [Aspergillus felis]|uniref:Uncharacterized protein n=1 Tax=Aspergillus felis TaxID=1287682 RepID=A0A8H6R2U1_9EURO|nr:hypothetical protein CNMCM7691_007616 [Aspergillus felis]
MGEIQEILRRSSLPGLASVQVAGAQCFVAATLTGEHAQITNHQYAVLVHHVPITYLPSSTLSAVEHLQEKILHCNPALRGPILHVGWCGNDAAARQSKQKSFPGGFLPGCAVGEPCHPAPDLPGWHPAAHGTI